MSTTCYELNVQEPSTTKNSSSSRAPKTGAQLRDDPEEREKCPTLHRHQTLAESSLSVCALSANSGDELSLRHLQQETQATTCTNRDIDHNVSTATAEPPQLSALSTQSTSRCTTTGVINLVQELHLCDCVQDCKHVSA